MGALGLLGWGSGGLAVAMWVGWLTQPPPWLAMVLGGLGVTAGWAVGVLVTDRRERHGGDGSGDGDAAG